MKDLNQIINNLKKHEGVDAVFLTGSRGDEHKPYSDIDLVVILDKNTHNMKSLYTWIGDIFSDVFFFDHVDLDRIGTAKELSGNTMDGVFVDWLRNSTIHFDKSGKLTALKEKADELSKIVFIPSSEKDLFWQKINYNLVANTRYFESNDSKYHEALEVRLLYSVSELFTGYFEFRDIVWRGEKNAMKYIKENDVNFYNTFISYTKASDLKDRFNIYYRLTQLVFPEGYKLWAKGDVLPQLKNREKPEDESKLIKYWQELIQGNDHS